MKRRFNPYTLPPWLRRTRAVCHQFIIPIVIFQCIRTIFIPTAFDILLLTFLIVLALALYLRLL